MAATDAMIERLRRMTGEVDGDYEDETLADAIERYPLLDRDGLGPDSDAWVARYDLNAAAADVWAEKAATSTQTTTASGGAVSSFTVAGASFTLGGASGSSSSTKTPQDWADYYRRRIAPRLV